MLRVSVGNQGQINEKGRNYLPCDGNFCTASWRNSSKINLLESYSIASGASPTFTSAGVFVDSLDTGCWIFLDLLLFFFLPISAKFICAMRFALCDFALQSWISIRAHTQSSSLVSAVDRSESTDRPEPCPFCPAPIQSKHGLWPLVLCTPTDTDQGKPTDSEDWRPETSASAGQSRSPSA